MTYPHAWIEVPATNRDYCLCGASSERHPQGRMLVGGLALGDCMLAMRSRLAALESAPTFADGVRAGLEAAAAWVDGDDTFDPLIPLTQHMNVAGLSHDERAQIEGILDAVLAGAAEAIRGIDPSTVKP